MGTGWSGGVPCSKQKNFIDTGQHGFCFVNMDLPKTLSVRGSLKVRLEFVLEGKLTLSRVGLPEN